MVVADEDGFGRLPGAVAVHRAGLARMLGDLDGTIAHARRALDLLGAGDLVGRGAAASLLGLAHWTAGELASALRHYAEGMASLEKAGYLPDVVGGSMTLADLHIAQGQLRAAMAVYERGLRVATGQGPAVLRGAADVHVGIAALLRERNDLDAARSHLEKARALGEYAGMPQYRYRWNVAMAQLLEVEGDVPGALERLDDAERHYVSDFQPDVRPVAAMRARMWIAQRRVDEALGWAAARGLSVEDELGYLLEFEHITLARIVLAQRTAGSLERATGLLQRLLVAAEEGARAGSVIEILALLAAAHLSRGDVPAALSSLQRAVTPAEPEGYVRVFADLGTPMATLLRGLARQGSSPAYVDRLRAALDTAEGATAAGPGLIEPLSDRELDVLRLLATDLGGPDIARELVVSLHTVRTHTQHIYAKLGVNNRRAAVRRATELGLTSRARRR